MPWVEWFVERFRWIEWVAFFSGLRRRPFNRIDAVWLLLRLTSEPVKATEVLVLGGSVTAGGGVGNNPARAWHAFLGRNVNLTVHHKGAIDPSYFLHCTGRFVDRNTYDAALFDLGANMFDPTCAQSLVDLVARVRCLSNAPSVGVIDWPGVVRGNSTRVAARLARATLIEVPHGPDLYSTDRVHPNALGHARIAERVRRYLARLPRDPVYTADCPDVRPETCYPWATGMPVAGEPSGWKLVDDSPTPHLMHKYGWASTTPGANLTLAIPSSAACGAIVTLAYLMSNFSGPFRLTCAPGCACTKIRTYHQGRIFPFPVITGQEGWLSACTDCDHRSIRVTHDTAFNLLREGDASCRVMVTALSAQRVRLDGLYVQTPSDIYVRYARYSRPSTAEQRWFGERALKTECAQNL